MKTEEKQRCQNRHFCFMGNQSLIEDVIVSSHITFKLWSQSNYFQGFHNGVKRINVASLSYLNFSDQASWVNFDGLLITIYNIEYSKIVL